MSYSNLLSKLQSSGGSGYDGPDSYESPDILERLDIFRGWPTENLKPIAAKGDLAAISVISDREEERKRLDENKAKEPQKTAIEELLAGNMPTGGISKPEMPQGPRGLPGAPDVMPKMGPAPGANGLRGSSPAPMASIGQPGPPQGMPMRGPTMPSPGMGQATGPRLPGPVMGARDGGLAGEIARKGPLDRRGPLESREIGYLESQRMKRMEEVEAEKMRREEFYRNNPHMVNPQPGVGQGWNIGSEGHMSGQGPGMHQGGLVHKHLPDGSHPNEQDPNAGIGWQVSGKGPGWRTFRPSQPAGQASTSNLRLAQAGVFPTQAQVSGVPMADDPRSFPNNKPWVFWNQPRNRGHWRTPNTMQTSTPVVGTPPLMPPVQDMNYVLNQPMTHQAPFYKPALDSLKEGFSEWQRRGQQSSDAYNKRSADYAKAGRKVRSQYDELGGKVGYKGGIDSIAELDSIMNSYRDFRNRGQGKSRVAIGKLADQIDGLNLGNIDLSSLSPIPMGQYGRKDSTQQADSGKLISGEQLIGGEDVAGSADSSQDTVDASGQQGDLIAGSGDEGRGVVEPIERFSTKDKSIINQKLDIPDFDKIKSEDIDPMHAMLDKIESMQRAQRGRALLLAGAAIASSTDSPLTALTKGGAMYAQAMEGSDKVTLEAMSEYQGRAIQRERNEDLKNQAEGQLDYYNRSLDVKEIEAANTLQNNLLDYKAKMSKLSADEQEIVGKKVEDVQKKIRSFVASGQPSTEQLRPYLGSLGVHQSVIKQIEDDLGKLGTEGSDIDNVISSRLDRSLWTIAINYVMRTDNRLSASLGSGVGREELGSRDKPDFIGPGE